jgi:hypothetical protein
LWCDSVSLSIELRFVNHILHMHSTLEILKDHINYIKLYCELFFFCAAIHYKISFHFVSYVQFKQFHVFINLYEKYRILYYKAYLLVLTLVEIYN